MVVLRGTLVNWAFTKESSHSFEESNLSLETFVTLRIRGNKYFVQIALLVLKIVRPLFNFVTVLLLRKFNRRWLASSDFFSRRCSFENLSGGEANPGNKLNSPGIITVDSVGINPCKVVQSSWVLSTFPDKLTQKGPTQSSCKVSCFFNKTLLKRMEEVSDQALRSKREPDA